MELRFSDVFLKVLEFSRDEAVRTGWHNVCPDHIMLGILRHSDNDACRAMEALGVDTALFKECIDEAVFCADQVPWDERDSVFPSESAHSMLQHAALEAARCKAFAIEPLHYLLAVCRVSGCYSHDWLADNCIQLRTLVEAAGIEWSQYGLAPASHPETVGCQLESPGCHPENSDCHPENSGCHPENSGCHPERSEGSPAPDPKLLAEAIEQRLREGYTTDNPLTS